MIPLVFHWNCYWIPTGFPMDFHLNFIEISTGYPMDFHWYFIEISTCFSLKIQVFSLKFKLDFQLISIGISFVFKLRENILYSGEYHIKKETGERYHFQQTHKHLAKPLPLLYIVLSHWHWDFPTVFSLAKGWGPTNVSENRKQ